VCVVDVGERVLAAPARAARGGMKVVDGEREDRDRFAGRVLELLMADHDAPAPAEESADCELELRAQELGRPSPGRYHAGPQKRPPIAGWTPADDSHPNIVVDHGACIVCDRCVRACTEVATTS